jgi:hypothetical protein
VRDLLDRLKVYTTDELIKEYSRFTWIRKSKEVHIHHTWKPTHKSFNGNNHLDLQVGIRNFHVNENGWSDIGQHLTLFPDGTWMIGRNWNTDPASITGRNSYGFAIEMIGNFDKDGTGEFNNLGYDVLQGKQLNSILKLLKFINLPIVFHRDYSDIKTCPGNRINKNTFIQQVKNYKEYEMLLVNIFGKDISLDKVLTQDDQNYISIRELFEKLGCNVEWTPEKINITLK